ncbi:hypothetical protein [Acanthopleuribacter pedis]|uniref:Uncharacterized protein n=1 Tax=Acanthopleuribacter pedis TaxID=442870 RepID=A0A8J7Q700_9BACT|nr:hypothetical protein [Acanthopleuribacter pedis]MBO1319396.1 hypothetical protein [Acanthopleuribacter pedis]
MSNHPVMEFYYFWLKEGITHEHFMKVDRATAQFLSTRKGFIKCYTTHDPVKNCWGSVCIFETHELMAETLKAFEPDGSGAAGQISRDFWDCIETYTVSGFHFDIRDEQFAPNYKVPN